MKDYLEYYSPNSLAHFSCFAYEALFLDTDDFKLNDLNERIKIFNSILKALENQTDKEQSILLKQLMEKVNLDIVIIFFAKLFGIKDFSVFIALVIIYMENIFFLNLF